MQIDGIFKVAIDPVMQKDIVSGNETMTLNIYLNYRKNSKKKKALLKIEDKSKIGYYMSRIKKGYTIFLNNINITDITLIKGSDGNLEPLLLLDLEEGEVIIVTKGLALQNDLTSNHNILEKKPNIYSSDFRDYRI